MGRTDTLRRVASATTHTALATGSRSYPSQDFARDGFVVDQAFLDAAEVSAIRADVDHFADREVRSTGVDGAHLRDRGSKQDRDTNVRQIVNVDRLSPGIAALAESGRVEERMHALTGRDLRLGSMTLQIDWPDTRTKRGLHVDSHWPVTYKAFLYLTDVSSPANGPFSVVPGSHRHRLRKLRAIAGDIVHRRKLTDLDHTYRIEKARCLTGGPGAAIFADQRLAHAGWPEHTTGTRLMLVGYFFDRGTEVPSFLR